MAPVDPEGPVTAFDVPDQGIALGLELRGIESQGLVIAEDLGVSEEVLIVVGLVRVDGVMEWEPGDLFNPVAQRRESLPVKDEGGPKHVVHVQWDPEGALNGRSPSPPAFCEPRI